MAENCINYKAKKTEIDFKNTTFEKYISSLAMKTLADGRFFAVKKQLNEIQWETDDPVIPDRISIHDALNFAWSLPISVLITGAENVHLIREKITIAKQFVELDEEKRNALIKKVADLAMDGKVEYFKEI